MKRGLTLATVFWLVMPGCAEDGRVLWMVETTQGGATGSGVGGVEESSTLSIAATSGAGGKPTPYCTDPVDPAMPTDTPCFCREQESCACEPVANPCQMVCEGDGCELSCTGTVCDTECNVGCRVQCDPGTMCTSFCQGACTLYCADQAVCELFSFEEPSTMFCLAGATCNCLPENGCVCEGIGCPVL